MRTRGPDQQRVNRDRAAARWRGPWFIARILLVLLLAAAPLLAISAHVFGLAPQNTTALLVIFPLIVGLAVVVAFSPHRIDMVLGRGLLTGMVACVFYDGFRLFCVHVLKLMDDFIPVMGTWITGGSHGAASAVVGYMWRYLGDGGGLGVAFFAIALAVGLGRRSTRPVTVVLAAVGFAVFVWAGLVATVVLAPRGEELMFRLTTSTLAVTLIGHVIFGLVLGLGFLQARRGWYGPELEWPLILSVPTRLRAYNVARARSRADARVVHAAEADTPKVL